MNQVEDRISGFENSIETGSFNERKWLSIFLYAYNSLILSLHNILKIFYVSFMVLIIYHFKHVFNKIIISQI